mmetsp:Transcript_22175/g.28933  ORF Transcript_22175/g.28933 Transcript_22175/m.28933 type:complete len:331 (+) Transcript_22175:197-1189(+)
MFEYLGQHESVKLPSEKEINFWGTPWPLVNGRHRLVSLSSFTFSYLKRFKLREIHQKTNIVYGEASPDYFISTRSVLPNILRYAPSMKIIVSLRDPIERFVSAYKNKLADKTIHKHVDKTLYHGRVDKRKDFEIKDYKVPTMAMLVSEMSNNLKLCPNYEKHYTLAEKVSTISSSSTNHSSSILKECYVNPFILHGYYSKYLKPWVHSYGGPSKNLLIIDFNIFESNSNLIMNDISKFLNIKSKQYKVGEIYNSRDNRGVHKTPSSSSHKVKTGGYINGLSKDKLDLNSWTNILPKTTYDLLANYYKIPNIELKQLLDEEGVTMSWLESD